MKIILSGGGTLGSVTPLLAMYDTIKTAHPDAEFLWVGTKDGPEKSVIEEAGMPFIPLSAGKLRRYFSLFNIIDVTRIVVGFFQAFFLLLRYNPDVCISAGAFISVPLHWAAWLLGSKTWIHQQDVRLGLSNQLMAPFATQITTAIEANTRYFSKRKTRWIGNPVRPMMLVGDRARAIARFHLLLDLPVVLVTGGGTGSFRLNQLITEALEHVSGTCQVIHLSGKDRPQESIRRAMKFFPFYQAYPFLYQEIGDLYTVADLVVARAGFGTITELAALAKPVIFLPKAGYQEENVAWLVAAKAALELNEETTSGYHLAQLIKQLLADAPRRESMGKKLQSILPMASAEVLLEIIDKLV